MPCVSISIQHCEESEISLTGKINLSIKLLVTRTHIFNVVSTGLSIWLWIAFQLYRPLNVRIALTAVEIWIQSDKIFVDNDSNKCLDNFMEYRNKELVKKYDHDNAQLLA